MFLSCFLPPTLLYLYYPPPTFPAFSSPPPCYLLLFTVLSLSLSPPSLSSFVPCFCFLLLSIPSLSFLAFFLSSGLPPVLSLSLSLFLLLFPPSPSCT